MDVNNLKLAGAAGLLGASMPSAPLGPVLYPLQLIKACDPWYLFSALPNGRTLIWLGRQDSNLRMLRSKPSALPLGDAPKLVK